jgi:hypothetical protein
MAITKTDPKSPEEIVELIDFIRSCPIGVSLPKNIIDNIVFVMKTTEFIDGFMCLWASMGLNTVILYAVHAEIVDLIVEMAGGIGADGNQDDFGLDLSSTAKRQEMSAMYMHIKKDAVDSNLFPVHSLLIKRES